MNQQRGYGVLLPHFGPHASREVITETAVELERLGFDAVWARDHIVYEPHEYEDPDPTFLDPIVVLSGVAAVTERIGLGTGTLIPHRHPVHTALLMSSLDFLAGPGRVVMGMGLGSFDHEFRAVGMGDWDRREVIPEQVEIMRRLWRGEPVTHEGAFYRFDDVSIHPIPAGGNLPIWYSGTSAAAVRRAVEFCDGWLPGSLPRHEYAKRHALMERLAGEAGKAVPTSGVIPWISPGRTVEEATSKVPMEPILAIANKRYAKQDTESYRTLEDLDGTLIAGPADVIAEEIRRYEEVGVSHFVFDLRFRFADFGECAALLADEVLPQLRAGTSSP